MGANKSKEYPNARDAAIMTKEVCDKHMVTQYEHVMYKIKKAIKAGSNTMHYIGLSPLTAAKLKSKGYIVNKINDPAYPDYYVIEWKLQIGPSDIIR